MKQKSADSEWGRQGVVTRNKKYGPKWVRENTKKMRAARKQEKRPVKQG